MSFLGNLLAWLPRAPPPARSPLQGAVEAARLLLARAAAAGRQIPDSVTGPILTAAAGVAAGPLSVADERAFYTALTELSHLTADISKRSRGRFEYPFEEAVEDSELLLKHASECGTAVPPDVANGILAARTALKTNQLTDSIRASFYAAYSSLCRLLGDVSAETIRNCGSPQTARNLRRDWIIAIALTALVAIVSVVTFVADSMSKKISEDVAAANDMAARLRVAILPAGGSGISLNYVNDPCSQEKKAPGENEVTVKTVSDVTLIQDFAATIRESRDRTIKLNRLMSYLVFHYLECDPYSTDKCRGQKPAYKPEELEERLQINPAIVNYTAEVLCKIQTYQNIRTFASDVLADYTAIVGGIISYALPIFYALLGAYAYRLRQFADTIKKRTYHPSFSDSARMITAVIAGAICGLFNPAQGLALSPLAVAFLVGYGVELFFRFLDTMVSAFGTPAQKPPA